MQTIVVRVYEASEFGQVSNIGVNVLEPTFVEFLDAIDTAVRDLFPAINVYATTTQFATMNPLGMREKIQELTGIQTEFYPGSKTFQLTIEG